MNQNNSVSAPGSNSAARGSTTKDGKLQPPHSRTISAVEAASPAGTTAWHRLRSEKERRKRCHARTALHPGKQFIARDINTNCSGFCLSCALIDANSSKNRTSIPHQQHTFQNRGGSSLSRKILRTDSRSFQPEEFARLLGKATRIPRTCACWRDIRQRSRRPAPDQKRKALTVSKQIRVESCP